MLSTEVKLGIGRFANSYQACNTKLYFSIHTFNTLSVTVVNRVEGEDIQMAVRKNSHSVPSYSMYLSVWDS